VHAQTKLEEAAALLRATALRLGPNRRTLIEEKADTLDNHRTHSERPATSHVWLQPYPGSAGVS